MQELRDEIRAILREELAALTGGALPGVETIQIKSSEDLQRFALDLLDRSIEKEFVKKVKAGKHRFELAARVSAPPPPPAPVRAVVTTPQAPAVPEWDGRLLGEGDVAELARSHRTVRVPKTCCITPLARDEARRLGLRIERSEG